ncbi:MAG: hypothetical protein IJ510_00935 [Selenomonadales bacterium]|nr:hypothetical protein [Selenomonadales bacterium]
MKRWIIIWTVVLMLMPSVCSASCEVRLSADRGMQQAEMWLDGTLWLRFIIADVVPTWTGEGDDRTVWLSPKIEGGMLKIIVR